MIALLLDILRAAMLILAIVFVLALAGVIVAATIKAIRQM